MSDLSTPSTAGREIDLLEDVTATSTPRAGDPMKMQSKLLSIVSQMENIHGNDTVIQLIKHRLINTPLLSALPPKYKNEVGMLRVDMGKGGMIMRRVQEVIGDRYTSLKHSGNGGRRGQTLFASGGKHGDRVKSRGSGAHGQGGGSQGKGGHGPGGWVRKENSRNPTSAQLRGRALHRHHLQHRHLAQT